MSDISIPGISSKYNTTKLIEDLVQAERVRLTRMEERVDELEANRSTWRQINRDLSDLQRVAKSLYGFDNPFSEKLVVSSDEGVLDATATRVAAIGKHSITVKKLASSDRFLTAPLEKSFRVDEGKYTFLVGDRSVTLHYRGGSLDDFASRLTDKGKGIVRASEVRNTSDTRVLLIEAVPTGSANLIQFQDDAQKFAVKTGMMQANSARAGGVTPGNLPEKLQSNTSTPQGIEIKGESIVIQPLSNLRIPLDDEMVIEEGMMLEFAYKTTEMDDENIASLSPPGPKWPEVPSGNYKGITVKSLTHNFLLPESFGENLPPERVDDWNIFSVEGSSGIQNLPPVSQASEFRVVRIAGNTLPADMKALLVENDNTHRAFEIKDIRLFDPSKSGNLEPVHAVETAGDAIVDFHGIEVIRPTNTIDDLVDGLVFNLKKPSAEPVDISVETNVEMAKEGIIRFVFSYNKLLTRILVLTSSNQEVVDELTYLEDDQRAEMEEQLGQLRGDTTLSQIRNRIQTLVTNPYTTSAGSTLRLLAQIGISTNASLDTMGGGLEHSKLRGYLEIDEKKLDTFLSTHISAVKDLFGNDTTGDLFINSGVAKALDDYLIPYTRTGGITGIRIDGIEGKIEDTAEEITDYKEHLDDFEADLRRQYGTMEAMLNQLENSSKELESFSQQQRGRQ